MKVVPGIASVLGVAGVISSFGLFYMVERLFRLNRHSLQTLMYLKLSLAGHLTILQTRTRGLFWSIRPARVLLAAVIGTQAIAYVKPWLIESSTAFFSPKTWQWEARRP
jgi:H+-transporting ATPase